ncbi:hypothetical protein [Paractinoplanes toevensis]|uniref:Uncharacterized protein n=1 Tax=Paractinoplanes toevensis TaxID=571911 RepID=A0A919W9R3_9ACTN|nr:hypothetical protein [Actinoplanes toevensis]GIM96232.1 hypothetical protein Ato02nite_080250 [Actinoplanes toevensis]
MRGRGIYYLYSLIGVLLLVAAFALMYPVRHVQGFATDVRINVGSNLLDLVLALLVLQPLIVVLSRNVVRRRNGLDYSAVIRRIEHSTDRVDVWKHWTGLLESQHEKGFQPAMHAALDRGVRFRFMLTDPSSPDAAERARQVAPTDAIGLMRQNIERLTAIIQDLPARHRDLFEVRISSVGPAHAFYRVDNWLSYGVFSNRRVSESTQREVRVLGDLGSLALEAFDNRWTSAGPRRLDDHYRLGVKLTVRNTSEEHYLRYVLLDGQRWVDVNPTAVEQAVDPEHEVIVLGDGDRRYVLADSETETHDQVNALYAAKYGPDAGALLRCLISKPG